MRGPAAHPTPRPGGEADVIPNHHAALLLALLLVAAFGCSDSHLVTGVYRSEQPVVLDDIPGFGGDGVYVELVLGQYGPDVTGLVRFFRDGNFLFAAPGGCDCRFVQDGRYDHGEVLFSFTGPVPCDDTAPLVGVRLQPDDTGDVLRGVFGTELEGEPMLTFVREVSARELTDSHKHCEEQLVPQP
jgi:hypothetical protein